LKTGLHLEPINHQENAVITNVIGRAWYPMPIKWTYPLKRHVLP